jgi:DNA-binding NarL/FixJ family response regulator
MNKVKILLADDHPVIRKGIKSIIETFDVASEIVEASDGKQVIELSRSHQFDLFIMDYKMPEMDGYDAAKILLQKNSAVKIVVISMYADTVRVLNLFKLGVFGFMVKNTNIEEIQSGINCVLKGDQYMSKVLEERIQREQDQFRKPLGPLKFSKRESELILLLSKGNTSREIALTWGLSLKTIETYRSRLLEKVNAKNTSELLNYCVRNGLV